MNYREKQRKKAIEIRDEIFKDPGDGIYRGKKREFVLSDPAVNLWAGIREDAIEYFKQNKITWWQSKDEPTGHLLSSQIACVNHLFSLRQQLDLATAMLKSIDENIVEACKVDTGYVEFEKTGGQKLGGERHLTRGENCTSIDALMVGRRKDNSKVLVLIEWKYTETYSGESKLIGDSGQRRFDAYKDFLNESDYPIDENYYQDLFYEPFYQMMRQTFLGWQMSKRNEYGANDWLHVDVIPENNSELREKVTSPNLKLLGHTIGAVWRSILIDNSKYILTDPQSLMRSIVDLPSTISLSEYLNIRYWQ